MNLPLILLYVALVLFVAFISWKIYQLVVSKKVLDDMNKAFDNHSGKVSRIHWEHDMVQVCGDRYMCSYFPNSDHDYCLIVTGHNSMFKDVTGILNTDAKNLIIDRLHDAYYRYNVAAK